MMTMLLSLICFRLLDFFLLLKRIPTHFGLLLNGKHVMDNTHKKLVKEKKNNEPQAMTNV